MTARKSYGKFIKSLREEKKLSQDDLAKELDCSVDTVQSLEKESIFPSPQQLIDLCNYFNVQVSELINGHRGKSKQDQKEFEDNYRYYVDKYFPNAQEHRIAEYKKYKRIRRIKHFVILLFVLVAFIIFLHWFNATRDLGYELSGSSDSFKIEHAFFLRDNGHYLFILVGPEITNDSISKEDVTYSKLSSGDRLIVATNDLFTGELTEPKGYDEYFPKEVVDNLGNWTYEITYKVGEETKTETIVLSSKEI